MQKIIFSCLTLFFFASGVFSQSPFVKAYEITGATLTEARKITRTNDGNFLVVGYSTATDTTLKRDGLVFKMSPSGTILWSKVYGGTNWEEFNDVVYLGGYYYCVGFTRSTPWVHGTYSSTPGGPNLLGDVLLVKLNLDGSVVWAKTMGDPAIVTGTNVTDGNETGLRLAVAPFGGVIVVFRSNTGSNNNQNTGLVLVDTNAKVKWAYLYQNSVLTKGIWRDASTNLFCGGYWKQGPTLKSGLLFKINSDGAILWSKQTNFGGVSFQSQGSGFYDNKSGQVFTSSDSYQSSTLIREPQIALNIGSTGIPPSGTNCKRFHYGAGGSTGNNFRSNLFPTGDGQDRMILTVNNADVSSTTMQYATVVSVSNILGYEWSKKVGYAPGTPATNILSDMITCDGPYRDLIGVGTLATTANKKLLLSRISPSNTLDACNLVDNINNSTLSEVSTDYDLKKTSISTWADNSTISGFAATNVTLTELPSCASSGGGGQGIQYNFIQPEVCVDANCNGSLKFSISKPPKEIYFEITGSDGDFVYERFYANDPVVAAQFMQKLTNGYDLVSMGLSPDIYQWEIEAVYDGLPGFEIKNGEIKVQ